MLAIIIEKRGKKKERKKEKAVLEIFRFALVKKG